MCQLIFDDESLSTGVGLHQGQVRTQASKSGSPECPDFLIVKYVDFFHSTPILVSDFKTSRFGVAGNETTCYSIDVAIDICCAVVPAPPQHLVCVFGAYLLSAHPPPSVPGLSIKSVSSTPACQVPAGPPSAPGLRLRCLPAKCPPGPPSVPGLSIKSVSSTPACLPSARRPPFGTWSASSVPAC